MIALRKYVRILAEDSEALQDFLLDPDAWVREHAADLNPDETRELQTIGVDLSALAEKRTIEALDNSPERSFCDTNDIGRRRFLIGALSPLLVAAFAGLAPGRASGLAASGAGDASDDICPDGAGCETDNKCDNNTCKDTGCNDTKCINWVACDDDAGCVDDECINVTQCNDSGCFDGGCENDTTCNDDKCIDDPCTNTTTCTDGPGQCNNGSC